MADELNTLVLNLDSGGDVVIRLRPDLAPGHVERISELAEEGFYDGVVFHRVIDGFMAQGGDPTGTGMGGSDKPDLVGRVQPRAACPRHRLDGAHREPRTAPTASSSSASTIARFLDGQYTVWGEVVEGMEHVDALPKGEPPRTPGKIVKATLHHRRMPMARPVTLITGASAGLGVEFARQCARRGEALALVARRRERLDAVAAEVGGQVHVFAADLALPGAAAALVNARRGRGTGDRDLDQQCRLRPVGKVRGPAARAPERDDRPQRAHPDRAHPAGPAGDARARPRRDPQRRLDRRLPARAEHGGLLRDQGLCPLRHRGAAPRTQGHGHQGLGALPGTDRHRILRCGGGRTAR